MLSQALLLASCSLPERPTSPTSRYGQVSVTVQTNIGFDEGSDWPLLVIRSVLTAEEHLLRQQKSATVSSTAYSGRIPPGRYRILGLVSNPTLAAKKLVLSKSLGNFDVLANKECQLGSLLHWRKANIVTTELYWNIFNV